MLGYKLTPRPVSVIVTDTPTGHVVVIGEKARQQFSSEHLAGAVDTRDPDEDSDGHVVLSSADPLLPLDPTLRQVRAAGIDAPSAILEIRTVDPEAAPGPWLKTASS